MVFTLPLPTFASLLSLLTGTRPAPSQTNLITHPTLLHDLHPRFIPTTSPRRLLIVGDVHGCLHSLDALLHHASFDPHNDHLILAGDLLNKGPSSAGVLRRARQLHASAVRGNHEDNLLRSAHIPPAFRLPPGHPRRLPAAKSDKLRALAESLSPADYEYLVALPVILRLGRVPGLRAANAVVVHAGIVPGVPLEAQSSFDAMHMRSLSADLKASEEREGTPWFEVWNQAQGEMKKHERTMVVYGHDSKMGLQDQRWSKGLDTGCVRGGRLTGLLVDAQEAKVVSVECKDEV